MKKAIVCFLLMLVVSIGFKPVECEAAAPTNSALPVISGTATVGSTLSTNTGDWIEPEFNNISYTYQWQADTIDIVLLANGATYDLTPAEAHKDITVVVTADDGFGAVTSATSVPMAMINSIPVNTALPVITGTPTVGSTLIATPGDWTDPDGDTLTHSRQWYRADDNSGTNQAAIGGAIGLNYQLTTADAHKYLKVVFTADDLNGSSDQTATSNWTEIINSPPVNNALPVISGTTSVGSTLIATPGDWTDADGDTWGYSIQWYRADDNSGTNQAAIVGASSTNYQLITADNHKYLKVVITADDGNGSSDQTATSLWTDVINFHPIGTNQAVSTTEYHEVAITLEGSDADLDPLSLFTVVTGPTNGALSGTAPNLTYAPNTDYYGSDSFTFTVYDGYDVSSEATVSITVDMNQFTKVDGAGVDLSNDALSWTTVRDNNSGLIWEVNAANDRYQYPDATSIAADLTTGGLYRWRLPTLAELSDLAPFDADFFPDTATSTDGIFTPYYWTSDSEGDSQKIIRLTDGNTANNQANRYFYLRAVHDNHHLSVNAGLPTGSTTVELYSSGYGFTFGPPTGTVTFDGVEGNITSWTDSQIVVETPAGAAGSAEVVVTLADTVTTFTVAGGFNFVADSDGDGVVDSLDLCEGLDNVDDDNDGYCNSIDICLAGDDALDWDGDTIPNACDRLIPTTVAVTDNIDPEPAINNNGHLVWLDDGVIYFSDNGGTSQTQRSTDSTNNSQSDINDTDHIVWVGNDFVTGYTDIFYWDGADVTNLTNNIALDALPAINNNGHVVWSGFDGADNEIFYWDGSEIIQLTDNDAADSSPAINDNGHVVWAGYDGGDTEIYYWDRQTTTALTANDVEDGNPRINNSGDVVWNGSGEVAGGSGIDLLDSEIFYWDGASIAQLTDNNTDDTLPAINDNGDVAWAGDDGADTEIYYWDGASTSQMTFNDVDDLNPDINNIDQFSWLGDYGASKEITLADLDSDADSFIDGLDACSDYNDDEDVDANGTPDGCESSASYQLSRAEYGYVTLSGQGGEDQLIITGSGSGDMAFASTLHNTFDGGGGNDDLVGYTGSDLYYFERGDGQDTIIDWGHGLSNTDEILFGPGIAPGDLILSTHIGGLHLVIQYGDVDQIIVQNFFYDPNCMVEQIRFDDGIILDLIAYFGTTVLGTSGDDLLTGRVADLTFDGLAGNDTIQGGPLNDLIKGGTGNDVITDQNGENVVYGGDGDDTITMTGWSDPSSGTPVGVRSWLPAEVLVGSGDLIDGGIGTDTIVISHMTNNNVLGGAGDDSITVSWNLTIVDAVLAMAHVNLINGGTGNDILMGYAGSDTYVLTPGDGTDTINDWDNAQPTTDIIKFVGVNVPADGNFALVGNNLEIVYGADKVVIQNWLDPEYRIESFVFDDGTLDIAAVNAKVGL